MGLYENVMIAGMAGMVGGAFERACIATIIGRVQTGLSFALWCTRHLCSGRI